jgi:Flavin-binding monooxygenase-like
MAVVMLLLLLLLLIIFITETYTMSVPVSSSAATLRPRPTTGSTPRIAVIGAGAAGLACCRVFSRAGWQPILFEKSAAVGGVWNYNADHPLKAGCGDAGDDKTKKKQRPMYRGLRTNLPKEVMGFREYPWTTTPMTTSTATNSTNDDMDSSSTPSYVTHQQVLDYLQAYTKAFNLQVQYKRRVQHLQVLPFSTRNGDEVDTTSSAKKKEEYKSRLSLSTEDWPLIELRIESSSPSSSTENSNSNTEIDNGSSSVQERHVFDAVIVANGHYSVPTIPHIAGVAEHFQGRTMHSIEYDNPQEFANQTVLCIGARASGADIARELSAADGGAKKVYLSDAARTDGRVQTCRRVSWVPRTVSIRKEESSPSGGSGAVVVQFDHDCPLQPTDVDVIIYCTGYDYIFPFIDKTSSSSSIEQLIEAGNGRVTPLYEQLWHAQYPNIAFVGLPHSVVPFPMFELQAEATLQTWKRATTSGATAAETGGSGSNDNDITAGVLPNLAQRLEKAKKAAVSGGEGKPNGHVPRDTHYLGNAQWEYCRRMARIAGVYDAAVEDYIATNKVCMYTCIHQNAGGCCCIVKSQLH